MLQWQGIWRKCGYMTEMLCEVNWSTTSYCVKQPPLNALVASCFAATPESGLDRSKGGRIWAHQVSLLSTLTLSYPEFSNQIEMRYQSLCISVKLKEGHGAYCFLENTMFWLLICAIGSTLLCFVVLLVSRAFVVVASILVHSFCKTTDSFETVSWEVTFYIIVRLLELQINFMTTFLLPCFQIVCHGLTLQWMSNSVDLIKN